MAQKQAEIFAAEIIAQGGPVSYNGHLIKDSTAIALIAYVQRLGTDLFAVPPTAPPAEKPAEAPATETPPTESATTTDAVPETTPTVASR